jgi:hypothetical protein
MATCGSSIGLGGVRRECVYHTWARWWPGARDESGRPDDPAFGGDRPWRRRPSEASYGSHGALPPPTMLPSYAGHARACVEAETNAVMGDLVADTGPAIPLIGEVNEDETVIRVPGAPRRTPGLWNKSMAAVTKTVFVTEGGWRTLETFFNASAVGVFEEPSGAAIKVRYGVGLFGLDGQKQTLNGQTTCASKSGSADL